METDKPKVVDVRTLTPAEYSKAKADYLGRVRQSQHEARLATEWARIEARHAR